MAETKAPIVFSFKGFDQLDNAIKKLQTLQTLVSNVNKVGGAKTGAKAKSVDRTKQLTSQSNVLNQIEKTRDRINQLDVKGTRLAAIKGRLTRAENAAKKGDLPKAKQILAASEKRITILSRESKINKEKTKELERQRKIIEQQLKAEQKKAKLEQAFRKRRRERIAQSALIGGGFPLLFGGSPLQALAGGLGGGIGEAISPGGGFAGSIAATAAVASIQEFAVNAREVGDALKDPTRALDALSDAGIKVDDAVKQQVATLLEAGKEFEALEVVNRQLNESIGELATQNLKDLDTSFDKLDEAAGKLFLKIKADLAPAFLTIIDLATKFVNSVGGQRIRSKAKELDLPAFRQAEKTAQKAAREANPNQLFGGRIFNDESRNKYFEVLTQESKKIIQKRLPAFLSAEDSLTTTTGTGSSPVGGVASDAATFNAGTQIDEALKKQTDLVKKVKEESALTLRISQLRADGLNPSIAKTVAGIEREAELSKENLQTEIDKLLQIQARDGVLDETNQKTLTAFEAQLNKMDELTDSQIESVTEQMKLAEAAQRTRDAFDQINNAIATNISDGLTAAIQGTKTLGEAAKAILNDIGSTLIKLGVNTILGGIAPGLFGGLPRFSRGGRPPVGRPSIVGEKGPELFVPRRSGTIIPNDKLGGGSTNISVNVDASGSSVQGNNESGKELGRVISAAIQSELLKQRRPGGLLR